MYDFYYQIKGKEQSSWGGWAWPPVFTGKVTAKDKKDAKKIIENEYERKFPLRVLKKDLENEHYLLKITEIKEDDERTKSLFEFIQCKECGQSFRVIDKYNDHDEKDKGKEFCSQRCRDDNNYRNRAPEPKDLLLKSGGAAFIYKILNKKTKKVYIGKTHQVFTLRWYQHFYQSGNCKFHNAIRESSLSDWEFSIIEIVQVKDGQKAEEAVKERESYWISFYNCIEDGYNTMPINN